MKKTYIHTATDTGGEGGKIGEAYGTAAQKSRVSVYPQEMVTEVFIPKITT